MLVQSPGSRAAASLESRLQGNSVTGTRRSVRQGDPWMCLRFGEGKSSSSFSVIVINIIIVAVVVIVIIVIIFCSTSVRVGA